VAREQDVFVDILNRFSTIPQLIIQSPLNLGGTSGSHGGNGGPIGGFTGQLPQVQVCADVDELRVLTSGSVGSLLDNLNNIRYWETLQQSSSAPSPTFAGQLWLNTSGSPAPSYYPFSARNTADTGWVTLSTGLYTPPNAAQNGTIALIAGSNMTITQSSGSFTFASSGGGGGVTGIYVAPNSAATGTVLLQGSGDIAVTQSSGSFTFSGSSGSYLPRIHDINGQYHNGFPLRVGNGGTDTVLTPTAGALLIGTSGGKYVPNNLTAGSNVTITNSSGSIIISSTGGGGGGVLDPSSPQDAGSAAVVGTSGSSSHGDHVHRGVTGIYTAPNTYAYGGLVFVAGTNMAITQSSGSFTFTASSSGLPPSLYVYMATTFS
jgi:hypothetical protein